MKQAFRETIGSRGILLLVVRERLYFWHIEIARHLRLQNPIFVRRLFPDPSILVKL